MPVRMTVLHQPARELPKDIETSFPIGLGSPRRKSFGILLEQKVIQQQVLLEAAGFFWELTAIREVKSHLRWGSTRCVMELSTV